ncbi:MAG: superoxide dismutase family protein [Actinomycetota bacterium]|nr:superoxide dismutase family protein [Actinomycetota bacterium]
MSSRSVRIQLVTPALVVAGVLAGCGPQERPAGEGAAGTTSPTAGAVSPTPTATPTATQEEVTEGRFEPVQENTDRDISGRATLVRTAEGTTTLSVEVKGLASNTTYPAHLHEGSCEDLQSPHYKHDPHGPDKPPNELWPSSDPQDPTAGLTSDAAGIATGTGTAPWRARPEADTVFIHSPEEGHPKIACAALR